MADIFSKTNAQELLNNKTIWVLGDSNTRAVYKDFVWLLQKNSIISDKALKSKLEASFMNDTRTRGDSLHAGRDYEEERHYYDPLLRTSIDFMFLTRCINDRIEDKIEAIASEDESPDLIIISSCLWDICRWGPNGVAAYKRNIPELLKLMKRCLYRKTLVIWLLTPPVAATISGGLVIKQIEFMRHSARFEVMEANLFVRQEVVAHGFDVLDLHYHLLLQIHRRHRDGIHWAPSTVRHITNLILTHAALSWGNPLPGNFTGPVLNRFLAENEKKAEESTKNNEDTLKELGELPITKDAGDEEPKNDKPEKHNKRVSSRVPNASRIWDSVVNRVVMENDRTDRTRNQRSQPVGRDWTGNYQQNVSESQHYAAMKSREFFPGAFYNGNFNHQQELQYYAAMNSPEFFPGALYNGNLNQQQAPNVHVPRTMAPDWNGVVNRIFAANNLADEKARVQRNHSPYGWMENPSSTDQFGTDDYRRTKDHRSEGRSHRKYRPY